MNTPRSIDEIMNEMNDRAKAQGRDLDKCFWEIPRSPGSILDRPDTPEAEERIRKVRAYIDRARQAEAVPLAAISEETQEAARTSLYGHETPSTQ